MESAFEGGLVWAKHRFEWLGAGFAVADARDPTRHALSEVGFSEQEIYQPPGFGIPELHVLL